MIIAKKFLTLLFFFTSVVIALGQTAHSLLRKGDKAFQSRNFASAEDNYRKAIEKDNSAKGVYNLGNSIYRQQRYDEAVKHYQKSVDEAKDNTVKSKAYHNLGNAFYQKEEFDKSVEAYKNSLRVNPYDSDTKANLAIALEKLREQQEQEKQQKQVEKKQDNKNEEKPQNQQQQNQSQKQKNEKEQAQDLSKEEAAQLLEIMNREEQKVQQKLKKAQAKPTKSGKDW